MCIAGTSFRCFVLLYKTLRQAVNRKVSAEMARIHAESEFEKYRKIQDVIYESDFDRFMELEDKMKNDSDREQ